MTQTSIRPAQPEDARGIATVHTHSWQSTYRGQLPDSFLDQLSVPAREQRWRQDLAAKAFQVRVAEQDGVIVGFVSFGPSRDPDAEADCTAEIFAIYLLAEAQGTGAGNALWQQAVGELKRGGYEAITVWVLDTNQKARRFYERMGCVLDGGQKGATIGGQEVVELRYRLDFAPSKG
ncbi:MAG: GNAT family N-acetyltransferase [Proteobacteria bacterium]|nr:GNAT family N-acetyltransferase [Pseudomonadota bacterium]